MCEYSVIFYSISANKIRKRSKYLYKQPVRLPKYCIKTSMEFIPFVLVISAGKRTTNIKSQNRLRLLTEETSLNKSII